MKPGTGVQSKRHHLGGFPPSFERELDRRTLPWGGFSFFPFALFVARAVETVAPQVWWLQAGRAEFGTNIKRERERPLLTGPNGATIAASSVLTAVIASTTHGDGPNGELRPAASNPPLGLSGNLC